MIDSDSSCSATDGSFDIGLGKTLGTGEFPSLDQSAPVYLYWPPGPFPATKYDKEPGGAGFEARELQAGQAASCTVFESSKQQKKFLFAQITLLVVEQQKG